ncbi:malectin-like carbohydrate-binding domain-containing protein, partial [Tanacetum coccineum]
MSTYRIGHINPTNPAFNSLVTSFIAMSGHLQLLPVLLALFAFSASGQFIASINCGASDDVLDLNSITWTPDENLVSNGDARTGDKVLVRASFNYGNYDGLSNPPTFDLHFDGNFWATVETTTSGVMRYEITYVAKQDFISVCVALINPGQFPFISAIEV